MGDGCANALRSSRGGGDKALVLTVAAPPRLVSFIWIVRYLTPRECERLQGIPDDHTRIPWRRGMASDSVRYKAVGNGMAVPCVGWLLERVDFFWRSNAANRSMTVAGLGRANGGRRAAASPATEERSTGIGVGGSPRRREFLQA